MLELITEYKTLLLVLAIILIPLFIRYRNGKEKSKAEKKEVKKTETTKTPDKPGTHGNDEHPHGEEKKGFDWFAIISSIMMLAVCIVAVMFFYWLFFSNRDEPRENTYQSQTINEFPRSGKEIATMKNPVKAFLDPEKSNTRILGKGDAKYVLESDTTKFFICNEKPEVLDKTGRINNWAVMPPGNYLIYPKGFESIVFKWWQQ